MPATLNRDAKTDHLLTTENSAPTADAGVDQFSHAELPVVL